MSVFRQIAGLFCGWSAVWLTGCGKEQLARQMVDHSRFPGTLRLLLAGPPRRLIERGRITAHRRVPAPDGTELDLWLIAGDTATRGKPRGTVLLLHGMWDSKARMLAPGRLLADRGFDVVLPDLRGLGRSGGAHTTFGVLEVDDLRAAMAAVRDDGFAAPPFYVVGFSMGGGIAIQYAAREPRCAGVLALAPAAGARQAMRHALRFLAPAMGRRDADAVIDRAAEIAGVDIDLASAVEAAPRLRCPLIVAQGAWDVIVPPSHGRAVFAAAPQPKRLVSIPLTGHLTLLPGRAAWIADRIDELAAAPAQK